VEGLVTFKMKEESFWLKVSELSLKKTWNNQFDDRWDEVL